MCFVAAVKGDTMRLRMAMHVHSGMKRAERRNKETCCRMWRMGGDWALSGIANVLKPIECDEDYCPVGPLLLQIPLYGVYLELSMKPQSPYRELNNSHN